MSIVSEFEAWVATRKDVEVMRNTSGRYKNYRFHFYWSSYLAGDKLRISCKMKRHTEAEFTDVKKAIAYIEKKFKAVDAKHVAHDRAQKQYAANRAAERAAIMSVLDHMGYKTVDDDMRSVIIPWMPPIKYTGDEAEYPFTLRVYMKPVSGGRIQELVADIKIGSQHTHDYANTFAVPFAVALEILVNVKPYK